MDLLLDTHALLWALTEKGRLSEYVRALLTDPDNNVMVSTVCAWEIAIKAALGKMPTVPNVAGWLPRALQESEFTVLPVTLDHAMSVEHLPRHHGDPFDRLLIAQALIERCTIVTHDAWIARYNVPVIRC
jgi:PIN domain nuclease of toxin-antitoxin system